MKISQAIRWLQDIKAEHGDIELLLPDGTPWKKIEVVVREHGHIFEPAGRTSAKRAGKSRLDDETPRT